MDTSWSWVQSIYIFKHWFPCIPPCPTGEPEGETPTSVYSRQRTAPPREPTAAVGVGIGVGAGVGAGADRDAGVGGLPFNRDVGAAGAVRTMVI